MSELLSVVSKSSSDLTTLAGAVRGVQSNLDQLSSKVRSMEDANRPQTCGKCGSTDHLRKNCPVLKAEKEAKEAKERKDRGE